jgi:hypothetical protein
MALLLGIIIPYLRLWVFFKHFLKIWLKIKINIFFHNTRDQVRDRSRDLSRCFFFQNRRLGHKAFIRSSARIKLTLNL